MQVQVYLDFDGRCDEAIEFYREALGAEVDMLMRFADSPDPDACVPGAADKVMHSCLRIGDTHVMASDGRCGGSPNFGGICLSLSVDSTEEAQRVFGALSEGGRVEMPLTETFYSPCFGMTADRFGVSWMVIVPQPE